MKKKQCLDVSILRACLDYDPNTGTLLWKERPRDHFICDRGHTYYNNNFAGKNATQKRKGLLGNRLAVQVNYQGKRYKYDAHRLVYLLLNGDFEGYIHAIDGDYSNLKISNLLLSDSRTKPTDRVDLAFIEKAKRIHGDKYSYHLVDYKNSRTKVEIYCKKHESSFWQLPSAHIQGQNCPLCGLESAKENSTKTTEKFVNECKELFGDYGWDYSKTEYTGAFEKVTITCPIHGDFTTSASNLLQSRMGCKECCGGAGTTKAFIKRSQEKHGEKFDYSKVEYKSSADPVLLICREHGEFWQRPDKHMRSDGCPKCSRSKMNRWGIKAVLRLPKEQQLSTCYFYIADIGLDGAYKVGITKDPKTRLQHYNREIQYPVSYIKLIKLDLITATRCESQFKKKNKRKRAKHDLDFGGKTEVFNMTPKELSLNIELMDLLVDEYGG